jgi:hypothetical protein
MLPDPDELGIIEFAWTGEVDHDLLLNFGRLIGEHQDDRVGPEWTASSGLLQRGIWPVV